MNARPNAAQPSPAEVQPLLNAFHGGQWVEVERLARALLGRYPQALLVLSVLGSAEAQNGRLPEAAELLQRAVSLNPRAPELHSNLGLVLQQQGRLTEAEASFRAALALAPGFAGMHFNLGTVLSELGRRSEAMASYQQALALQPRLTAAHFNLAMLLQSTGDLAAAETRYRLAIEQEPGFIEALGNLGALLQGQGRVAEAIQLYQRILAIRPDALAHFNLGTACRDAGLLGEAVEHYHAALRLNPRYAEACNNLGEIERDQGHIDAALANFRRALACEPGFASANYNIGLYLYDSGQLAEAIDYFESSRQGDWAERVLVCLYKTGRFAEFRARLERFMADPHRSPMAANLSAHHATNFRQPDLYGFCPDPLGHVYHSRIDELAAPASALRAALLTDITQAQIDARQQGRLHHGVQSAGNLFKRPEESFARLAALIKAEVLRYRATFAASDCVYMREFPAEPEFNSSWYVKMRKGGHLTSHIHETGWLSGCVYLSVPERAAGELGGCIEFSLQGDQYPQQHQDFPTRVYEQAAGDIVLFPSSLFHRTIPFESDSERICVAFDIRPPQN